MYIIYIYIYIDIRCHGAWESLYVPDWIIFEKSPPLENYAVPIISGYITIVIAEISSYKAIGRRRA